jgi:hypothetical protein
MTVANAMVRDCEALIVCMLTVPVALTPEYYTWLSLTSAFFVEFALKGRLNLLAPH